ncbi:MAG TPA: hypothetical protein PLG65_06605, partial [Bacillota bacterium]|nr:hypothetical protein [Bacillota bacterium]
IQPWSSPDLKRRPIDCMASTTGSAYDLRLDTVRLIVRWVPMGVSVDSSSWTIFLPERDEFINISTPSPAPMRLPVISALHNLLMAVPSSRRTYYAPRARRVNHYQESASSP